MNQQRIYRFDDFLVDPDKWRLSRRGREVHLEPVVLKLLIYLIANRDRLVTRQELMDTVWGDTVISESALSKAAARLRKALEDDSAAPRYLETVHSQGYRFIAEVEETERPDRSGRRTEKRRGLLAGALAIVVLTLVAVFWTRGPEDDITQASSIGSLAVLPLSNLTGDAELDYYVDGLQDILITELSQIPGMRVTSRQSTRRYRDSQLAATDIARELGVDALVEGSLLRAGSQIELTIQLVDGGSDEHLWAERYARESAYIFDLISEIATAIGAETGLTTVPPGSEEQIGPVDPRAIDAYSLGLTHMDRFTPDGIRFAIEQFESAVAIEPGFALGWGQLAVGHAMLSLYGYAPPRESIEKARTASLRAIDANDQSYIGHSTLGWVRLWTGDFDGACESFREALRLNPSAPYALHGDADCLMLDGRMDESIERVRELLLVGPFSVMHNRPLPYHLFLARRFDEAITAGRAMQARTPGYSMHWFFARVYWQQRQFDQALEEERLELERRGDTALMAALAEGREAAGPTGALRSVAEVMVARADESYVDPFRIAETFARAGLIDEAIHWLDEAIDYGSYEITYLAFQPEFDILRDHPRYQELVERVYGRRSVDGDARSDAGLENKETVVLETGLGSISIELYLDRAPLSSGSFLDYLDRGLMEESAFYRVVTHENDNGSPVISVVQGGLLEENKMLAPVAHETTEQTGLSHVDGAVSLARGDPGSGSAGAFFICVGDNPALDFGATRNPDKQGFAVFGRVVAGMDVVRAIQQLPADRPTDVEYVKGQLLREPVEIVSARRVAVPAE